MDKKCNLNQIGICLGQKIPERKRDSKFNEKSKWTEKASG